MESSSPKNNDDSPEHKLRITATVKDRLRAAQQKKKKDAQENKSKIGAALGKFLDEDENSRPKSKDAKSISGTSTTSKSSRRRSSKLSGWRTIEGHSSSSTKDGLSKSEHRGKLHRSRSGDSSISPTKSPTKHQSTRPKLQKSESAKLPSRRPSMSRSKSPDDNKGRLSAMLNSTSKSPRSRRTSAERSVVSMPADQRMKKSISGKLSPKAKSTKKPRSSDNDGRLGSMLGRDEKRASSRGRRSGDRSVASMPADYRRRAESAPADRHSSRKDRERSTSRNPSSRDKERSRSRSTGRRRPSMRRLASESLITHRAAEAEMHSSGDDSLDSLRSSNRQDRVIGKKVLSKASVSMRPEDYGTDMLRSPSRQQGNTSNGSGQSILPKSRMFNSADAPKRRNSMAQTLKKKEAKHKRVRSSGAIDQITSAEESFRLEDLAGLEVSDDEKLKKKAPDASLNNISSGKLTATFSKKKKETTMAKGGGSKTDDSSNLLASLSDIGHETDSSQENFSDDLPIQDEVTNRRDALRRHRSMDPVRSSNPYVDPPVGATMRANSMMLQREKGRRVGKSKSLMDLVEYKDEDIHSTSYFASNHVLINRERMKRGLRPLVRNSKMDELAREHSKRMAESNGCTPIQTTFVGNVMRGESIRAIHKITMANKHGRERYNLLNPYFQEFGVGTAQGKDGQLYLCQLFSERIELTLMDTENQPSVAPY